MNTVIIWILAPIAAALLLVPLQKLSKLSASLASFFALVLAVSAFVFPTELVLELGASPIILEDSLNLFGRSIQITGIDLKMIGLLYLLCFAWNTLSHFFRISQWFNSLSLAITALWVTVQFINPFLYAAVIIELIALISVPLLSPRGMPAQKGIIRFLSMQTLALPMILLNGWMVEGIETAPSAQELILRGALLVTVGFVLWLGIFPLHSWLPMLTEESHPWTVTFLLTIMQISLALFFLKFLNQYAWLRNIEGLDLMLRFIGVTSIFAAGTFGIFQKYLGRMLGYFFLAETGFILLAISYINQGGLEILQMSLLPRALSFLILGFTGSVLHQLTGSEEPEVDSLRGMIWKYPMTSLLLIFNSLNLIGLPLFMSFPYKNTLHNLLSSSNFTLMIVMVLGSLGLLVLSLRIFSSLIHPQGQEDLPSPMLVDKEHPILIFTIVMIILLMVAGGIFPQLLSTPLSDLLQPFQNLIQ
ncbi:MAG TPA: hypothetical protein GX730_00355 [Chloroflexi bacterium]|jgi:NADH:ubiquinone oxidoreductase subunit 2 (subunit N)|nr:proton-conducting transporter membrane subunit [Anaerolineaceae bacterium]HHX07875.1 hypothetical protein [Chloroflexota bacterium]